MSSFGLTPVSNHDAIAYQIRRQHGSDWVKDVDAAVQPADISQAQRALAAYQSATQANQTSNRASSGDRSAFQDLLHDIGASGGVPRDARPVVVANENSSKSPPLSATETSFGRALLAFGADLVTFVQDVLSGDGVRAQNDIAALQNNVSDGFASLSLAAHNLTAAAAGVPTNPSSGADGANVGAAPHTAAPAVVTDADSRGGLSWSFSF